MSILALPILNLCNITVARHTGDVQSKKKNPNPRRSFSFILSLKFSNLFYLHYIFVFILFHFCYTVYLPTARLLQPAQYSILAIAMTYPIIQNTQMP